MIQSIEYGGCIRIVDPGFDAQRPLPHRRHHDTLIQILGNPVFNAEPNHPCRRQDNGIEIFRFHFFKARIDVSP